ncbi:Coiled-coil-helix-coiled-coil-helix domain-containing protein 2 [Haplosporangium sp. Z 767]|nr:Coiled-coil-helix-coiled-coil-helix domain-containing protein 2 [Haplosporangium sp. Z 11]KAF9180232.1 Coiled-coil-helix-coiled-coil-helix domain-containing protein 2 [Haplosporangium sp. Z 767]
MARQRSRAAPAQQTRKASTMPTRQAPPPPAPTRAAPPPQQMTAPPAQPTAMAQPAPQQPGMFAQMATTAAGVAVGSAVGHTIGAGITSMFGGSGSSEAAPEPQQQQSVPQYQQPMYNAAVPASAAVSCETDAKAFTKCLEANGNDMSACQWYLEQLKACQSMSAQY